jgi:hypothetical protein
MRTRDMVALTPGLLLSALLLAGCGSAPAPKVEKKPAEPVTGLHALYAMYGKARMWAPDIKVLRLSSIDIAGVQKIDGKKPAWQAIFVSESLGKKRAYTYSVVDASTTLREGTFPDSPTEWSNDNRGILMPAMRSDTDKAWEIALKHGEQYAKKNPDMPISYTLEMGRQVSMPMWRVIWGESATSSSMSVLVDSTNGQYLETLH